MVWFVYTLSRGMRCFIVWRGPTIVRRPFFRKWLSREGVTVVRVIIAVSLVEKLTRSKDSFYWLLPNNRKVARVFLSKIHILLTGIVVEMKVSIVVGRIDVSEETLVINRSKVS